MGRLERQQAIMEERIRRTRRQALLLSLCLLTLSTSVMVSVLGLRWAIMPSLAFASGVAVNRLLNRSRGGLL